MPLMDHLRELRNRLVKAMIAIALGTAVGYYVYTPVWEFLKAPYCALPEAQSVDDGCNLIFTGVFDAFFVAFKVWVIVGILVSSPFWLYQLWAFVAPALRRRERKFTYVFLPLAVMLFLAGAALAYYITKLAMEVLFGFAPADVAPMITIDNYLNYMMLMMVVFGVGFVMPLLVALLNLMGVLPHAAIAKWRRVIIFFSFVLAAVLTPAEPISMLALAIPIIVLFELAELFCFLNDRRTRSADPLADLDDDEISALDDVMDDDDNEGARGTPKR
ncbi:twin-arginine translocase subunit TatC [Nocardiopsis gilva YIM 90087]|uniref:Sec-independent protein translocase protein TatC n=1 Tax=Nocardiopsis gilva YIM 90087 TaxID=1235441 RepID=A0A223S6N9_9ACTN|nr:twin-arginine translocase subunit TatC [Nocardiopsis gilva]ASU83709.1 twin-arginine translocase subunit TatC [Nocardiopsis gilva YIM 90087]